MYILNDMNIMFYGGVLHNASKSDSYIFTRKASFFVSFINNAQVRGFNLNKGSTFKGTPYPHIKYFELQWVLQGQV